MWQTAEQRAREFEAADAASIAQLVCVCRHRHCCGVGGSCSAFLRWRRVLRGQAVAGLGMLRTPAVRSAIRAHHCVPLLFVLLWLPLRVDVHGGKGWEKRAATACAGVALRILVDACGASSEFVVGLDYPMHRRLCGVWRLSQWRLCSLCSSFTAGRCRNAWLHWQVGRVLSGLRFLWITAALHL